MSRNSKSFTGAFQQLFSPQAIIPFLVGTILLAITGGAIYDSIKEFYGANQRTYWSVIAGCLVALFVVALVLRNFVNKLRPASPLVGKQPPYKRKGLILLVSNEVVCRKAIEQ